MKKRMGKKRKISRAAEEACSNKRPMYARQAREKQARLNNQKLRTGQRDLVRSYRCEICGWFHLTSKPY